jgi:hypothetical protein
MELQKNTADAFIDYLKEHGYPEDCIATEWKSGNYRIDIVVLDEDRHFPVAIYEVKGTKTENSLLLGIDQLKTYIKSLGYPVEAGLVFHKKSPPFFEYVNLSGILFDDQIKKENLHILEDRQNIEPLSYQNAKNSAIPKLNNNIREKKERKLNTFNAICWVLAGITTVLLVLENLGIIEFSVERLILFGVTIVLLILPFFSEIKLGEISFIKDPKNQKKD